MRLYKKLLDNKHNIIFAIGVILAILGTFLLIFNSKSDSPSPHGIINDIEELSIQLRTKIDVESMKRSVRELTKNAHVAGTENNEKVARAIHRVMRSYGVENVHFNEYEALLSYPKWDTPNHIEILDGDTSIYKSSGLSPSIIKDEQNDPAAELQWLAYSADGEATGDVVYANYATDEDFSHLENLKISVENKIVIARYGPGFRGNKAKNAALRRAKALIIYSDPEQVAPFGHTYEHTFNHTEMLPPDDVQRGTIYTGTGDPTTPLFPSKPNLYRTRTEEEARESFALPKIPVIPISYTDAFKIMSQMVGPEVQHKWRGGLNVTYRYGPGLSNNLQTKIVVHSVSEIRKIKNVFGYIMGRDELDKVVILSNHFDAWTYGSLDPNAGTAALLEVARVLMSYHNETGWRPSRSILFAHFDAEEYGLIGSTEFCEEHREQLMRRAIALVNMDCLVGNQTLMVMSSPVITNVAFETAQSIKAPLQSERDEGRETLYDSWLHYTPDKTNFNKTPRVEIPAGGSDQLPFFDYLGVPIIWFVSHNSYYNRTYPLYHSAYETAFLSEQIVDRDNFASHRAMTEFFIEAALRFAEKPVIPYNVQNVAEMIDQQYIPSLVKSMNSVWASFDKRAYLELGYTQLNNMIETAQVLLNVTSDYMQRDFSKSDVMERVRQNGRLIEFEKCFLSIEFIDGDMQSKNLLYSKSKSNWYGGEVFPQLHNIVRQINSTTIPNELDNLSKKLATEISRVHFALMCARKSLIEIFTM